MCSQRTVIFSLAEIERRLDELRLTEDVTELRREVDALVKVARCALAFQEAAIENPIPLSSATAFRWVELTRSLAKFDSSPLV